MKVIIQARPGIFYHEHAQALVEGMTKHGRVTAEIRQDRSYASCDLYVMWGYRNAACIQQQKVRNKNVLIMERGYIRDRFKYTSLGFNGLNGQADFVNNGMPSGRWDTVFADLMKPWRVNESGYVLLIGQTPNDMTHAHIDINKWYLEALTECTKLGLPVRFRPHPNVIKMPTSLDQDLAGARVVLTFNSNTGVDAVLAGVPVIAVDPISMVHKLVGGNYENLLNLQYPDRTQWARDIAYTQWTVEEIKSGEAWDHLKKKYDQ